MNILDWIKIKPAIPMKTNCKFCNLPFPRKKRYEAKFFCKKCNVRYVFDNYNNDDQQTAQVYFNYSNDKYESLVMIIKENRTMLYLYGIDNPITVNQVWLETKPEDMLQLAKRIYKLNIFS